MIPYVLSNKRIFDERGSILIYGLIVLTVLSLIGAIGIQTTWFELNLSGNDRVINRLKTKSESAASTAAALIGNQLSDRVLSETDLDSPTRLPWLVRWKSDKDFDETKYDAIKSFVQNPGNWSDGKNGPANCTYLVPEKGNAASPDFMCEFSKCRFQAIDVEKSHGSSLQTGNNQGSMHDFYITGLSEENSGKCMTQIGFRKYYKQN